MSRFVDLINKKFTGEQRKEDIPILYYDDGDSIFRHMYGGNKRNRNNSHKYTVDEINKDAHAAIDNIMKKDCEYHRKIDEALITAMTMGNLHK